MTRIFISYRRVDSEGYVGRLYDQLLQHFDKGDLFLDVGTIKPGEDFVAAIERTVATCDALIAVIGPQWLNVRDQNGYRRLDNPTDYVRLEIATALKRNILVIPVLVARATMPKQNDLPADIADLSRRNAVELSHDRFSYDVERIAHAIGGSYGKLVVRVAFQGSGSLSVHDGQKALGMIKLDKYTKPLTIQVEEGAHNIYAIYSYFSDLELLKLRSNLLSLYIKVGQTQLVTIERETISKPYKTVNMPSGTYTLPLDDEGRTFGWSLPISTPRYRILIKPY